MVRKILLGCGIVASVLYVVTDILGTLLYPGYSYTDNTFSELLSPGSPVRPLMLALNIILGTPLFAAFAVGVWTSASPKRVAHITGAMLLGYMATGAAAQVIFPEPTREVAAAGEAELAAQRLAPPCDAGEYTLPSAGCGVRVQVARKAVPVLLVRDNPRARLVWRFVGPAGWPS